MTRTNEVIFAKRNLLERVKNIGVDNENYDDVIILIASMQHFDGSFGLLEGCAEHDVRVELNDEVNYICTSLLIKTYLRKRDLFDEIFDEMRLSRALDVCSGNNLLGHGYDVFNGQVKAMNQFLDNDLSLFIKKYRDFNNKFTNMIENIIEDYKERIESGDVMVGWNENYEENFKEVLRKYED